MKRKLLVAGPVALVVIIALIAFLAWPRGGTAVTEDEALENFRSDQSTTTTSDDAGSTDDEDPKGERTQNGQNGGGGALWRSLQRAFDQFRNSGGRSSRD